MAPEAVLKVFLFTDLVESTQLKQRVGDVQASAAIQRHDDLFRECLKRYGGHEEVNPGDGFFATFDLPSEAVRCALAFVGALGQLDTSEPLRVRMGVHMGETSRVETTESGRHKLVGLAVDTAARVMGLSLPGQILLTRHAFDSVRQHVSQSPDGNPVKWLAHGRYAFKGVDEPLEVFEVGVESVSPLTPPLDSEKAARVLSPGDTEMLGWRPAVGLEVPGRSGWMLERALGAGAFGEVWVARHERTRDLRAFKFCYDPDRLRGLKRELTLLRLMKESLGERRDIARLYEARLDKAPFFLEMEYTNGGNLAQWAKSQGGLGNVPLETRLNLIAETAEALSAAHSAGVIHKDVSPSNVLIHVPKSGPPEVRLSDFGIGQPVSAATLKEADITITGFDDSAAAQGETGAYTGTRLYMAPEVVGGKPPSVHSDAYALGVLLYQIVVGDLNRPLKSGWAGDVEDDLLLEDIAACAAENPSDRLADVGELAQRLRSLASRREALKKRRLPTQAAPTRVRRHMAIEGYDILRELHRGGQGIVYQAVQKSTKRKVALKVLLEGAYASDSARRRFEREIELVASLKHPNIVAVFDSGETNEGRQYCAMEYVRGVRLDEYVREKKLSLEEVLQLFAKVCEAVQYAHQKGVIHRDLKPSNIMVDSDGTPRVLDFGLAKWTGAPVESVVSMTGQVVGTLPYLSPEQARSSPDEIDTRTDVYTLGIVLYELLTGQYPYPVKGQLGEVLRHITETPPTPPRQKWKSSSGVEKRTGHRFRAGNCPIDSDVQTIMLKTLSKEPASRYQSAGELARDILHYLDGEPIDARGAGLLYVLRLWFRHNMRAAFWIVAIGVFCGAVGSLGIILLGSRILFEKLADTYASFPSQEPPLFANVLPGSPMVDAGLTLVGVVVLAGMGLVLVLLVKPKDRFGDIASGLGAGLIAGVVSFLIGTGTAGVLAYSVAESIGDLSTLARMGEVAARQLAGETVEEPIEDRSWGYPEFDKVPASDRPAMLMGKIVADLVAGVPVGIWIGMIGSLWGFGFVCMGETVAAGYLIRRGDRARSMLLPYLLLTASVLIMTGLIPLILVLLLSVVDVFSPTPPHLFTGVLFFGVLATSIVLVVTRRWGLRPTQEAIEAVSPTCKMCGYDLRGQVLARCPECGNDFSSRLLKRNR